MGSASVRHPSPFLLRDGCQTYWGEPAPDAPARQRPIRPQNPQGGRASGLFEMPIPIIFGECKGLGIEEDSIMAARKVPL